MAGPLQGVKIFDLTIIGVGPFATMILASMGANVVKVDPPDWWSPPRQGSPPNYSGLSIVYMACQLGKRGILLDLKTPDGHASAVGLIKEADVFVENMKWGTVQRLGLGYEEISKLNPSIVYGNFPGWGADGPYADWGSGADTAHTFGGATAVTGRRGGEPESLRWYLHDFNASSYIAMVLLLGLLHRERTSQGLHIMNPQVGASVAIQTSRIAEFLATGQNVPPMGSSTTTTVPHRAFHCQDKRWLAVGVIKDSQWRALCRAIKADDLLKDPRFATNPGRVQHRDKLENRLGKIFASKPARWWTIQLRRHKVPVSPFLDHEEIFNHPQVKANKYFLPLKYPRIGTLPFGNIPFQYSKTPIQVRPGLWPGEHTSQVLEEGFGDDGTSQQAKGYFGPKGAGEKGILDGITVVDTTEGITGPYASLLLADSGARVIKVEPPEGDYARQFMPQFNGASAAFFHLNRNKEGTRLDMRNPEDRKSLLELLKAADVFIEEEGQPSLKRWGLSYQDLEKLNPRLVYCTITPFGTKGPLRNQPASELVLQAMSDLPNNLGVPGEEPVRMGPDYATAETSLYVNHAILGALYHAWRTGEGQHITISQLGAILHQKSVQWVGTVDPDDWNGAMAWYLGLPDHPHKTGDVPIKLRPIEKAEQMPELLRTLGMERYIDHPVFKNPPNKIMSSGGMGEPIDSADLAFQAKRIWEEAFKKWRGQDLVQLLAKFGSRSTEANNYQQLYDHPQTKAMGLFKEADDPKLGKVKFLTSPWKLHGIPAVVPEPFVEGLHEGARTFEP